MSSSRSKEGTDALVSGSTYSGRDQLLELEILEPTFDRVPCFNFSGYFIVLKHTISPIRVKPKGYLFKAEKNEWIKDSSSPFTTEIRS